MTHGPLVDAEVVSAARRWWRSRRPVAFTLAQHIANPTINCVTSAEDRLARAVVKTYRGWSRTP